MFAVHFRDSILITLACVRFEFEFLDLLEHESDVDPFPITIYMFKHTQTHTTNFTRNTKNASLIKMANHSIDRNIIAFSEFNLFSIVHIWITHSLFFSHSLLSLWKNCLPSFPSTPFFPFAPEIQFKHEHYFTNAASTTKKSNTQCNILHSF